MIHFDLSKPDGDEDLLEVSFTLVVMTSSVPPRGSKSTLDVSRLYSVN